MQQEDQSPGKEVLIEGLGGFLKIPEDANGIVLFAHGSGSSRYSTRNQYVARMLNERGLGTLLMDLLTPEEESVDLVTRELRFDIDLLARRVVLASEWLDQNPETKTYGVGLFGSSTGAAAALVAAAEVGPRIKAVVSRGGRPDLAAPVLPKVQSPTLLIVGGNDFTVIEMNKDAYELLQCEKRMEIVEGATHLFEEPGTLDEVAKLTRAWFVQHF